MTTEVDRGFRYRVNPLGITGNIVYTAIYGHRA